MYNIYRSRAELSKIENHIREVVYHSINDQIW